jgi:vacuolar-type H+-ATPase subunit F/Vma7
LYRLMVITDFENAPGFELTGLDVSRVTSSIEAVNKAKEFMSSKIEGVVILNQSYFDEFDDKFKKEIDVSNKPIFMTFPDISGWKEVEPETKYVSQLIQRALGYAVKIKGA